MTVGYGASAVAAGAARRLWGSIVAIGLAAALIELVPILSIQNMLGSGPEVVFQSIAMSVLGKSAFAEGLASAALGLGLHALVSVGAAAVYVLFVQHWVPSRPIVGGLAYGVLVYVAMTFVVLPLSRIGFHLPTSFSLWAISFSVHLFAFGVPIALLSRWLVPQREAALALGDPRPSTT